MHYVRMEVESTWEGLEEEEDTLDSFGVASLTSGAPRVRQAIGAPIWVPEETIMPFVLLYVLSDIEGTQV